LWDNAWAEFIPFLDYGACCKIARRRPRAKKLDVAALQFWSPRRRSLVFREVRASRSTHGLATCRLRNRLYDVEIRTVICSTDDRAIESLNARYRRAIKARGHFPNEQSVLKCLDLVTRSLDPTGVGRPRWKMRWKPALNAFATTFSDRFPAAETY
jgi:hypothetical protein